ncbi:hypothetical protein RB594_002768 [Gaeumannomyces avenae]
MDHSHHMMDHSGMDHGGMDHGGMAKCSMNMLFTWDTTNLCIVFERWHIRSTAGLIFSLLAVVAIGAGYEALRESIRRYEHYLNKKNEAVPRQNKPKVTREAHVLKAVLYGIQNFYAFMIMLIFMTYNGWVMIAVSFGAFLGYLLFGGSTPATKETACH